MRPRYAGLGLLQAWLWLSFLNGPLLYASPNQVVPAEIAFAVFLIAQSATFFSSLLFDPVVFLGSRRNALWFGAVAATLGTAGFALPLHVSSEWVRWLAGVFAPVVSGIGGALVLVEWGRVYGRAPVKVAGASYAASVTAGTILFLAGGAGSTTSLMAIASACPVLSAVCLQRCADEACPVRRVDYGTGQERGFLVLPARLILLIILVYCVGGCMYDLVFVANESAGRLSFWLTNLIYAGVSLAAGAAVYFNADLDLRYLYKPVLPLLGAGFVLSAFLGDGPGILSFVLLQAGFALFDMFTWLLFAYLSGRDRHPARVIGLGMLLITFSILLGKIALSGILTVLPSATSNADRISIVAALIALAATMMSPDSRETFAGWDLAGPSVSDQIGSEQPDSPCIVAPQADQPAAADPARFPPAEEPTDDGLSLSPGTWSRFESLAMSFAEEHRLTQREREIASLLLRGRNNPYIRETLNISNNTLKTHLRNIYQKMGLRGRQDLVTLFTDFANRPPA